jgi:hypothetical protein
MTPRVLAPALAAAPPVLDAAVPFTAVHRAFPGAPFAATARKALDESDPRRPVRTATTQAHRTSGLASLTRDHLEEGGHWPPVTQRGIAS